MLGKHGPGAVLLIDSFIFYTAYPLVTVWANQPIPADIGREVGFTLDRSPDSPSQGRHIVKPTSHTDIYTYGHSFEIQSEKKLHVFGLWEDAEAPTKTNAVTWRTCKLHYPLN